ncbi:hypothetical protein ACFQX6_67345 [Streptosporangium lutulentum]
MLLAIVTMLFSPLLGLLVVLTSAVMVTPLLFRDRRGRNPFKTSRRSWPGDGRDAAAGTCIGRARSA